MAGAVALGSGVYGLFGSAFHGSALLHPSPNEDIPHQRDALFRDLAFLFISLPSLALLKQSRRFAERPELRMPSCKTMETETDNDLVHVIGAPSREELIRVRDLEDDYYDLHLDWWSYPEKFRNAFEDAEDGVEQVRRSLRHWERQRGTGDEIAQTEALMEVAKSKAKLAVHLSLSGRGIDGEMYEKAASIHLLVIKNHLDALNRNLEGAPAKKDMPPVRARVREIQKQAEDIIQGWSLFPARLLDAKMVRSRVESEKRRMEEFSEKGDTMETAEALIAYALAVREQAFILRFEGDVEGFTLRLMESVGPMKRARRILRRLEME